jgi:hypothetical protein
VEEGGDAKPADRSTPIELAARKTMQLGVQRPEQCIRDDPFIASPARQFGNCVHDSHQLFLRGRRLPGAEGRH